MQKLEHIDSDLLDKQIEEAIHSEYRLKYHIEPDFGEMGAPCGFMYINGLYHLFYEWRPTLDKRSATYLYHVTSKDLVEFRNEGIKVHPDNLYDNYNIYGGSLAIVDNILMLFYTGEQEKNGEYYTYQLAGVMDTDFKIKKLPVPLVRGIHKKYTQYFRNPYVYMKSDEIQMILGAMNNEEFGRAVMYRGKDLESLRFFGELDTGYDMFGHFWESPELFTLEDSEVLILNPRGLDKYKNNFWNIYQSGYMLNDFEDHTLFLNHDDFYEFDYGFDFYRPVTTLDKDNNRVLIAAMSAHESEYPSAKDSYQNALTIPRVLSVSGDKIIQHPHPNLKKLRKEAMTALGYFDQHPKRMSDFYGSHYELYIRIKEHTAEEILFILRKSAKEETIIKYNAREQKVILDRTFSGEYINNVDGTTRTVKLFRPLKSLHIFMDTTSIEIFLNDGDHTMTARIFPSTEATGIEFMTEQGDCLVELEYYRI